MAKFLMAKRLTGLYPVDEIGEAAMRKFGMGEIVSIEVKRPRNVAFHKKFFAMLQIILTNQEHYKSIDDLLDVCKLRIGHCHSVQTKDGEVRIPDSISFASMDSNAFDSFYDRACLWVCQEVIPGLDRLDLDAEVRAELIQFGTPEG